MIRDELDIDKDQKFILSGPFDEDMPYYYIIIKDYIFWNNNEKDIEGWMIRNLPRGINHQSGMVLTIEEEKDAMLFLLRWGP